MLVGRRSASDLFQDVWAMYKRSTPPQDEAVLGYIRAYSTLSQRDQDEDQMAEWAVEQAAWVLKAAAKKRRT
jgi:hypothetical protein